jgi:hypothetical protein
MDFEILGDITVLGTIAARRGIRDLKRLQRAYGKGRWRKMKGGSFEFRVGYAACGLIEVKSSLPAMRKSTVRMVLKRV